MSVAAVGGEDDGAENVGFAENVGLILDGEYACRGVIVVIVETPQSTGYHAIIGVPIGEQGAALVPEVADIDGAESIIGMQECSSDDVVAVRLVFGEGLDLKPGRGQVGEVVEEIQRAFCAQPMGIEADRGFAFGYEV